MLKPHQASGMALLGATQVMSGGKLVLVQGGGGVHEAPTICCHPPAYGSNQWIVTKGSSSVFAEGRAVAYVGCLTQHCGQAPGTMIGPPMQPNVIVGA